MILNFNIDGQSMKRDERFITVEDSLNYLYCKFHFLSDDWKDAEAVGAFFENKIGTVMYMQATSSGENEYICSFPSTFIKAGKIKIAAIACDTNTATAFTNATAPTTTTKPIITTNACTVTIDKTIDRSSISASITGTGDAFTLFLQTVANDVSLMYQYSTNAQTYSTAAGTSATAAADSATAANNSKISAAEALNNTKEASEQALTDINASKESALSDIGEEVTAAKSSADAAKASEDASKASETNAKNSETNSKTSETNAKTSETNAKTSADTVAANAKSVQETKDYIDEFESNAVNDVNDARISAIAAITENVEITNVNATNAKNSETNSKENKNLALTYANESLNYLNDNSLILSNIIKGKENVLYKKYGETSITTDDVNAVKYTFSNTLSRLKIILIVPKSGAETIKKFISVKIINAGGEVKYINFRNAFIYDETYAQRIELDIKSSSTFHYVDANISKGAVSGDELEILKPVIPLTLDANAFGGIASAIIYSENIIPSGTVIYAIGSKSEQDYVDTESFENFWTGFLYDRNDYQYAFMNFGGSEINPPSELMGTKFNYAFMNCKYLLNANNITIVNTNSKPQMIGLFMGDINLMTAPTISAETFAGTDVTCCRSYSNIFTNCTNLTSCSIWLGTGNQNALSERIDMANAFLNCSSLTNITFSGKGSPKNLDFSTATSVNLNSFRSLYNSLQDVTTLTTDTLEIKVNAAQLALVQNNPLIDGQAQSLYDYFHSNGWLIVSVDA